ncbi:helix-turn-helix transcriptional regulator [Actinoplanes sp. NPDC051346]|uniref:helix-turn-helix domain-containing protein n=1 Tax=Actinoplanes sp. NPDC051346 TaxID=3155048 RepID=UPI0034390F95
MSARAIISEITGIVAAPEPLAVRAEAVLTTLRRRLRFDAGRISLHDPERRLQPTLASCGYDQRLLEYFDGPELVHNVELLGLHRRATPVRISSLPIRPAELPLWAEHLHPAGFREGIAVPLRTTDGRYFGVFSACTESATPICDTTCGFLARTSTVIAHAVDPMRTIAAMAGLVTDAVAGVVLTRGGNIEALPGLPGHRLLAPGSPVLAEAISCYRDGDSRAGFLTPTRPPDPPGYLKVTMLTCGEQLPHHLTAIIVLHSPGDLRHLSHREMTILGRLITGGTVEQIAAALRIPQSAVNAALEQARTKLGARSSAAAVMRAADLGLYLPPPPVPGCVASDSALRLDGTFPTT